jgi:hypothetical protein
VGDVIPLDVKPTNFGTESLDTVFTTSNGTERRTANNILSAPSLLLSWELDAERKFRQRARQNRFEWCIGENYNASTVFLWRAGRGLLPMIGKAVTFTRAALDGTYLDPESGLYRIAAGANTPRYEAGKAGRAIRFSRENRTNSVAPCHPTSTDANWTTAGTATTAFDTEIKGILDPDDENWDTSFHDGTTRAYLPDGTANYVHSDDVTVIGSTAYSITVFVKGNGLLPVSLRSGVGAPSTTLTSTTVTLTDEWQEVVLSATTGGTHNTADIALGAVAATGDVICWISAHQFELGAYPSALVQTVGAPATRIAEDLVINHAVPPEGTFSFWIWWPGDLDEDNYYLFYSSAERWSIHYDAVGGNLIFTTDSGGSNTTTASIGQLVRGTWYHMAVTWERDSGNLGKIATAIYLDGASQATATNRDWSDTWGDHIDVWPTKTGTAPGGRMEEVRLDAQAMTADEISDLYDRLVNDEWLHVHRDFAGRRFRPTQGGARWVNDANPDKIEEVLNMRESSREDESLVVGT